MKNAKILLLILCCVLLPAVIGAKKNDGCVTIQDGTLTDSAGNLIELGYDKWGYNYQAHIFNGFYDNSIRPEIPFTEGDLLQMKWNDAWLSNKDCGVDGDPDSEPDGALDRYYGFTSYIGSGAWLTNHQSGEYEDEDGKTQKWNYFVKIVAVPADAVPDSGVWYDADGTEIGPVIWGEFAIIQEVYNDTGTGEHGISYLSPAGPGFGKYAP